MKKIIAAFLALSCSAAFAGNAYVGANIGSAKQKLTDDGFSASENSTSFGVNAGYQITPMIGGEVGYVQFGEASAKSGEYTFGVKPKSVYVAATVTLPVTPQFAVVFKGGVASSDTTIFVDYRSKRVSEKKSGTSAMISIGATYAFTPAIAVVVEYANFGKVAAEDRSSLKIGQVTAGMRYSF